MNKTTFGNLIHHIRKNRNLSNKQLSLISGVSERQLQRIQSSETFDGNNHTITQLSKALNVNLVEYAIIASEFNTFEEYEIYNELRNIIASNELDKLDDILINFDIDDIDNKNFNMFSQIIYYSTAIQIVHKRKNYKKALKLCFKALNIDKNDFSTIKIKTYLFNDFSYAILAQIENYTFILNDYETAKKISSKLIDIIENIYYDTEVPTLNVPNIIFRTYIYMLNNQADSLFVEGNYAESLIICNKSINILSSNNSTVIKHLVFFLTFENYYCLNDFENAQKYLDRCIAISIAENNYDYINNKILPKVNKKYPKLNIPNIF